MPAAWKTVRVFISSTFRDMHAERDHLVRFVFPQLREELLKRRINLVDVDLRWGVTSEQDALKVCREIVDECRPRFLCILGGRYGWTPPGQEHSITAEEIQYSVLDRLGDHGDAYFHFRDPAATDSIPEGAANAGGYREFPQRDEIEQFGLEQAQSRARGRSEKLAALKQAIVESGLKPTVYSAKWDDQSQRLAGLEQFGEQVYEDLWEGMLADPELHERFTEQATAAADEFAEENEAMEAFVAERTERYVIGSRQKVFDRLAAFSAADGQPNIMAITGNPGCGKSAMLGEFSRDVAATHADWLVVPHFVGASAGSADLRHTLRRLCHELQQAVGSSNPISQDVKELIGQLPALLKEAGTVRRIVVVVDALNQMDATDGAHSLSWLPLQLPANVRMIVSALEHPVLEALRRRGKLVEELTVHPLTDADARAIAEGFAARYHKRLSEEQTQQLLGKSDSGTPLYLLVALEELRTLGTYEEITRRIAQLPGNVRDLFLWILRDRLSADPGFRDAAGNLIGADLVRRFVSYLGVSRRGLSHQELVGLIAFGDPQGNVAALERLLRPYLMRRGELVDFFHGQLREAVEREYLDEPHEPLAAHGSLAGYFAAQGYSNRRTLEELPHHQTRARLWDKLEATLTDLPFLEAKHEAGLTFELVGDFSRAIEALPEDRRQYRILCLLDEALRRDIHFIVRHAQDYPQGLFQCLWNSGWWYDCSEAAQHYVDGRPPGLPTPACGSVAAGEDRSINEERPLLHRLLESWRRTRERARPGFLWLRRCRPPLMNLGTAQLSVLRGHEGSVVSVSYSQDGVWIASGSWDNTVRIWDAESGEERAVLRGHEGPVCSVAFSPGGDRIVSGSGSYEERVDNTVRLWDARSGAELAVFRGHEWFVSSVVFSPDGRRIVSGSYDRTVRVWDAESGAELAVLCENDHQVIGVDFSPSRDQIVGGSMDDTVRVWDVGSGRELAVLRGHEGTVNGVVFSLDGRRIVSGSSDKTVRVWDAESGAELAVLRGHKGTVNGVAFSLTERRIVSGSDDKTVRVWDADSGLELRVLRGHEAGVYRVAFSLNGRRIVSGSADKTVRVWDAESGAELAVLRGHEVGVKHVAFSPDGRRIVSGSEYSYGKDDTVRVWDAESGAELAVLRGHSGGVKGVAFSLDGWRIVSRAGDKTVRVWDARTGAKVAVLHGHVGKVFSVAFSLDGRRIVSGSGDCTVRVWDAESGTELAVLRGHKADVNGVAFSPDGRRIVSGSNDKTVRVWDTESGTEMAVLSGHEGSVSRVVFSPDGRRIVSGSNDKTVRVWDAVTGRELAVLGGHEAGVRIVAFSPDGRRIVSASAHYDSKDKTVRVWDVESGAELAVLRGHEGGVKDVAFSLDGRRIVSRSGDETVRVWDAASFADLAVLREHDNAVKSVAFSPGGDRIVTGSGDKTVRVWDVESGRELAVLRGHEGWVISVAFAADGRRIVSGSNDNTVRVWNAESGAELRVLRGHKGSVARVTFAQDGQRIVSASAWRDRGHEDQTVRVWDAVSGMELRVLDLHGTSVNCVAFSPDARWIVSGSASLYRVDDTVRVWDAESGMELRVLRGHKASVNSVECSSDGRRIVSGSGSPLCVDNTVRVWDTESGRELAVLRGHEHWVSSVAFSPGGDRIASGSYDKTVRVWDAESGRELAVLRGHEGRVNGVAFSPDGRRIVSGSDDKTMRLWDAERYECVQVIQRSNYREAITAGAKTLRAGLSRGREAIIERTVGGKPVDCFYAERDGLAIECFDQTWAGWVGSYLAISVLEGGDMLWGGNEPQTPPATIEQKKRPWWKFWR